ncbi:Cys-tRNA(Pro) deacylase [Breoghania sp. JC706]|uniref:Cys-tRNA(Pro) deacylase n=1 Tax=Breoghania sp. JC706 TaxID=3117732 RepID=UPI00300BB3B5
MSTGTPATQMLKKAKVAFRTHEYDFVAGQHQIGLHAAEAVGLPPERVLKTLMIEVDGRPACAVIPSNASLSMKRIAAALGGKSAAMMDTAKAERLTGYHKGGISPFGQRKRHPTVIEEAAMAHEEVVINGGKRGLMVMLAPKDAVEVVGATVAGVCAEE